MKVRLILILFLLGTISCKDFRRGWSDWYEYKFSNSSVYWTKDQVITPDFFIGQQEGEGSFSDYFGVQLVWDKGEILKFNIQVYFDKKKSWMKPQSEWEDHSVMPKSKWLNYNGHFNQIGKLLKLKFDYLECGARELRKYLKEEPEVDDTNIKGVVDSHWDKTFQEWQKIQEDLGDDISDSKLKPVREMVDKKLGELKDFDPRVNSDL